MILQESGIQRFGKSLYFGSDINILFFQVEHILEVIDVIHFLRDLEIALLWEWYKYFDFSNRAYFRSRKCYSFSQRFGKSLYFGSGINFLFFQIEHILEVIEVIHFLSDLENRFTLVSLF